MRKICLLEVLHQPPCGIVAHERTAANLQQLSHPLKKGGHGQATYCAMADDLVKSEDTPRANMPSRGADEIRRNDLVYQHITPNHHIEWLIRRKLLNRTYMKVNL